MLKSKKTMRLKPKALFAARIPRIVLVFSLVLSWFWFKPLWANDDWRMLIQTQPLAEVVIQRSQAFGAEVISQNHTQLASELNARISHIDVRPGETVSRGQRLVRLDCSDQTLHARAVAAQQQENQAHLALAELKASRLIELQARQLSAQSQLDEINTQRQQLHARAALLQVDADLARRQIARCEIMAPFDGSLINQHVGVGQWVSLGTPLLDLVQTQAPEILADLPFSWLQDTLQNTQADGLVAVFDVQGMVPMPVELLRISPSIDPSSRSVKVWFKPPQPLAIGLSGQLNLIDPRAYLPAQVIVQRQGGYGVFTLENNQLRFRVLDQAQEGRPYPLPADWPADLLIVTQGQQRLQPEPD